ncbi:aly/REF export factor 2-like [Artemia franciscana]|uniref:RRM domain-containing protein n=1 Tax=Artemia franciscana TaxID=6661 RepID=A0AA88KZ37_ARTSF|nr:hypothetical protein QYM36_013729 [Artemia franciscana]
MDQSLEEIIKARKLNGRKFSGGSVIKRRNLHMRRGYWRERGGLSGRRKFFKSAELRWPSVREEFGGGRTKLFISNLDFRVNDKDIRDLFSEFGPIKSAAVHYDRNVRSLGTANVIYERRMDAIQAMKQYNDIPLDGRKMKIEISLSEIPAVARTMRLGSLRISSGRFRGYRSDNRGQSHMDGRGRARLRGRGSWGGGCGGRKPLTAEQLDKELDSYIKMDVS